MRWLLVTLMLLFVAYVGGRAAGILLDLNPYVTELVATAIVLAVAVDKR